MLCATACAHELLRPIWPRYPADTPSDDACWPPTRPERLVHRERGLVTGLQARLGLGRPRSGVLLQEAVRVLAPSGALADQRHLGLALEDHQALDERRERHDGLPGHLAQRRPLVAEDARIAVLVGADGAADPHVEQHACRMTHRMLDARVLRIGLDALELGLGANALDLELGTKTAISPDALCDEGDRPLGRQEAEAREVLDVVLAEEHVAGELAAWTCSRSVSRLARSSGTECRLPVAQGQRLIFGAARNHYSRDFVPTPASIQRIYLLLLLGNTLAASFIWGINTIFLLDAGLSNLEAFAANAFFTAGMVVFEVPTGIVADTIGRRVSYLLGTVTLAVTTLLYVLLWQVEGPFWAWAVVSMLLGLGFTFFSGAVEAWLVDALTATGFEGNLESVFGRGQVVAGAAMLTGSVAGGYIAQVTSLGVPFVLRAVVLVVMFGFAFVVMKDVGFTPERAIGLTRGVRRIAGASIEYGWRVPAVKWIMLASPFTAGVGIYAFYALQPYLLELYGDPEAYGIAGLVAAIVAGAQIVGGLAAPRIRKLFQRRTSALLLTAAASARHPGADRRVRELLGGDRADRRLGTVVRGLDADPAGVPERTDSVAAARDDPLLRLDARLERRRRRPAGAGALGRRLGLRGLVPARRRHLGAGAAVRLPLPPAERAGRHGRPRHGRSPRAGGRRTRERGPGLTTARAATVSVIGRSVARVIALSGGLFRHPSRPVRASGQRTPASALLLASREPLLITYGRPSSSSEMDSTPNSLSQPSSRRSTAPLVEPAEVGISSTGPSLSGTISTSQCPRSA